MNKLALLISFVLLISCSQSNEAEFRSDHFNISKLSDGVFACIHKIGGKAICNSGIIDNGRETIIFDTFLSPQAAEDLKSAVEFYNLSPIKYIVNSHAHNDHIRGNQVFSNNVRIISTERTKELIEEWEPDQINFEEKYAPAQFAYYDSLLSAYEGDSTDSGFNRIQMWRPYYETLMNSSKEIITTLPREFVDSLKLINGPDKEIHLISKGRGHTESDLILYLPEDGIIFTGDLLFNNCHPYMGDGFAGEWLSYLDFIMGMNPKIVIPGHGDVADYNDLIEMREYITSVERISDEMFQEGKTEDDIDKVLIPEKYRSWLFGRFFKYNLSAGLNKRQK